MALPTIPPLPKLPSAACGSNSLLDDIEASKNAMKLKMAGGIADMKSGLASAGAALKSKLNSLKPTIPQNSSFKSDFAALVGKTGIELERAKLALNEKWGKAISGIDKLTSALNPFSGESSLNLCKDVPNSEGKVGSDGTLEKVEKAQASPAPVAAPAAPVALTPTIVDSSTAVSSGVKLDRPSNKVLLDYGSLVREPMNKVLNELQKLGKTKTKEYKALCAKPIAKSILLKNTDPNSLTPSIHPPFNPVNRKYLKNPTQEELAFLNNSANFETALLMDYAEEWRYKIYLVMTSGIWGAIVGKYDIGTNFPASNPSFNSEYRKRILDGIRDAGASKEQCIEKIRSIYDTQIISYFNRCDAIISANADLCKTYKQYMGQNG